MIDILRMIITAVIADKSGGAAMLLFLFSIALIPTVLGIFYATLQAFWNFLEGLYLAKLKREREHDEAKVDIARKQKEAARMNLEAEKLRRQPTFYTPGDHATGYTGAVYHRPLPEDEMADIMQQDMVQE